MVMVMVDGAKAGAGRVRVWLCGYPAVRIHVDQESHGSHIQNSAVLTHPKPNMTILSPAVTVRQAANELLPRTATHLRGERFLKDVRNQYFPASSRPVARRAMTEKPLSLNCRTLQCS